MDPCFCPEERPSSKPDHFISTPREGTLETSADVREHVNGTELPDRRANGAKHTTSKRDCRERTEQV